MSLIVVYYFNKNEYEGVFLFMDYLILFFGFLLLVKGADLFVDGASGIARFFKIPSLVIGLTIVSIGTSAPEAAVSITAALQGSNGIALGNIIGSNIFNTAMVIGICALIKPISIDKNIVKKDFPFMLCTSVVAAFLMFNGVLSRLDGVVLLLLFACFMGYIIKFALDNKSDASEDEKKPNLVKASIFSLIGVCAIIWGGDLVVASAKNIALGFGISEAVIGLTVVAIGTSLPELVTSIVAAKKGESDIAIGNVIGSNIFNLLFILGLSSTITPIASQMSSVIDIAVFISISLFVYLFAKAKGKITRAPATILVLSYVAYTAYLLIK